MRGATWEGAPHACGPNHHVGTDRHAIGKRGQSYRETTTLQRYCGFDFAPGHCIPRTNNSSVITTVYWKPPAKFVPSHSLHAPLRGRDAVRDFATKFRAAFPDLTFGGTADLIAGGDYAVGQWIGGGTHTGEPMIDLPLGGLPEANTGKTMRFTGTTILKVENGLITEEVGLDDGVSVLRQLGLIDEG